MAEDLNYKPLIKEKIEEFIKKYPNYTFGEIMYSVAAALRKETVIQSKAVFLEISDADFYTGIDRALKLEEKEEPLKLEEHHGE